MKREILLTGLIIISLAILVLSVSASSDSSVSQSSSYVFVKQWGTIGDGDEQFGGLGISEESTFMITDDVIKSLKNKIDDEKLKLLETLKNREFDKKDDDTDGFIKDNTGELRYTLRNLKFNDKEIYVIKMASALQRAGDILINGPLYIAVDQSDNIYVSDFYHGRIQKFDSEGNFILKWPISGGNSKGLTIDKDGNVYVVACYSNWIEKFNSQGNFILKWGSKGLSDEQFNMPESITTDNKGYVYVIDSFIHYPLKGEKNSIPFTKSYVKKFDSQGNFILKWDQRVECYGITINLEDHMFLALDDFMGGTSIAKSKSLESVLPGNPEWELSSENTSLHGSVKLAVDSAGNVFAVSRKDSCVYKFAPDGNLLTKWGSSGSEAGEFNRPEAIAVDSKGNVYVMDTGNYRIQKFAPVP